MTLKTVSSALNPCLLVSAFLLLGGCSKPEAGVEPAATAAPAATASVEETPAANAPEPAVGIEAGMAYAEARVQLVKAGWTPPPLPANGFSEADTKVKAECNGSVALCTAMPELEACSGSNEGACVMNWSSASGKQLRVSTTGGLAQAKVQSFQVMSASGAASMACPSLVFEDFLTAYRNDVNVQRAFTADPLEMTYLDTASADASPKELRKSLGWEALEKPVMVGSETLANEGLVQAIEGGDKHHQVVETQPGTGVKTTYEFSQFDGCWRLTAINDQSI